jgi:hypothetical protein
MAELLCAGVSHAPMLSYTDDHMADILRRHLASDRVPPERKDPSAWPPRMLEEFGREGENWPALAARERERVIGAYRQVRREIDAFQPDVVLIWGDDQYENFHEDLVPPFCVYAAAEYQTQPFMRRAGWAMGQPDNIWGEPRDKTFVVKGHPEAGRHLARRLLEEDRPVAYAYKLLHHPGLAHAFMNTVLYLDYDRRGFDYPVLPFHVNCYGSELVRNRGGDSIGKSGAEPDPPAPSPRSCFDTGAATARIMRDSPWRAVLMGSSSWSHAFLTPKNHFLYPDIESDRRRFEELREGRQHLWRELDLADIEAAGQAEFLNWVCLAGAMTELDVQAEVIDYSESYVFNSSKCTMVARPSRVPAGV